MNTIDYIYEYLKKCRIDDREILGLIFHLSARLSYRRDGDDDIAEMNDYEYVGKRFDTYLEKFEVEQSKRDIDIVKFNEHFEAITDSYNELASIFDFYLENDRKNASGEVTTYFKSNVETQIHEKVESYSLKDLTEIFEKYFFHLGVILSKVSKNHRDIFVLQDIYSESIKRIDMIGWARICNSSFDCLPPFYRTLFSPNMHKAIFDKNGLLENGLIPCQVVLQSFINGQTKDYSEFIWDQFRILFWQQDTLELVNTEYQHASYKSWENLTDYFFNDIPLQFTKYHEFKRNMILQENVFLEQFVNSNNIDKYTFIHSKIEEIWGFCNDKRYQEVEHLTFFTIFVYSNILYLYANKVGIDNN